MCADLYDKKFFSVVYIEEIKSEQTNLNLKNMDHGESNINKTLVNPIGCDIIVN